MIYKLGSMPPLGYLAKQKWAEVQLQGGLQQAQCGCCNRWFFPQEMELHNPEQAAQQKLQATGKDSAPE